MTFQRLRKHRERVLSKELKGIPTPFLAYYRCFFSIAIIVFPHSYQLSMHQTFLIASLCSQLAYAVPDFSHLTSFSDMILVSALLPHSTAPRHSQLCRSFGIRNTIVEEILLRPKLNI
jgi:hypothetical protein